MRSRLVWAYPRAMAVDDADWGELIKSGAPMDSVLRLMRDSGASRFESMRLLVELGGMSLADAKAAVHLSPAWSDLREETDQFHEEMARLLQPRDRCRFSSVRSDRGTATS